MKTSTWTKPHSTFCVFFCFARHGGPLVSQSNRLSTRCSKRQRRCQDQKKRRWCCCGHVCFSSFHPSFFLFFQSGSRSFLCSSLGNILHRNSSCHFFSAVRNPKTCFRVRRWRPEKLWLLPGGASLCATSAGLGSDISGLTESLHKKKRKQTQFSKAPLGFNLRLLHRRCPGAKPTRLFSAEQNFSFSTGNKKVQEHQSIHTSIDGCSQSRNWWGSDWDDRAGVCEASSNITAALQNFHSSGFLPKHCSSWRLRSVLLWLKA